jgi:hypothetical protein
VFVASKGMLNQHVCNSEFRVAYPLRHSPRSSTDDDLTEVAFQLKTFMNSLHETQHAQIQQSMVYSNTVSGASFQQNFSHRMRIGRDGKFLDVLTGTSLPPQFLQ